MYRPLTMDGTSAELDQLAEQYVDRIRRGEPVQVEEYARRHPALADAIRELFPVLAVMEGMKSSSGSGDERAGDAIGPYRIVRELGRGGMGRVYEALDASGERVALKVVHPHLVQRPGYLARFFREVEAGVRLDSPRVVRTLGSGIAEQDGIETPYLALEFVEGQNLRELLDEVSPLSERLCRVIGANVARGLAAIHAAGMVHRDIKPENVVITENETVKLMDLGVAALQEDAMRLTATGEFVGSLLYAAPEQISGDDVTPAADLYALGLLLFELMTARNAHADPATGRIPILRKPESEISLLDDAPHASPFLDALVRSLISIDPRKRPPDAETVATLLTEGESSAWWRSHADRRELGPAARRRKHALETFGRRDAFERLDDAAQSSRDGVGGPFVIEGDPGIGKSHLVSAWLGRGHQRGTLPPVLFVERAGTHAPGAAAPFAAALTEHIGCNALESRVRDAVGSNDELVDAVLTHLRGEEEGALGLPSATRDRAYARLLEDLARDEGLIVVMEDLHYLSENGTQAFLELARGIARTPVLLLATTRTPLHPALAEGLARIEDTTRMMLPPLDRESAFALVQHVIQGVTSDANAVRDLVRRSGGNPHFLIELCRELERTTAGATTVGTRPGIPDSLGALLDARVAALPPDARELLSAAACSGDLFDPDLVITAAQIPRLKGLRMLHALDREHRLLEAVADRYRFRQRLVQEQLHDDLPPALRAAYHTALGDAMESRLEENEPVPGHVAFAITRHHLRGEDAARAIPYAIDALAYTTRNHESRRSVEIAECIEAFEDRVPPSVRANVLLAHGTALVAHGSPADALAYFEKAYAAAQSIPDAHLAMRVLVQLVDCERETGEIESAFARVENVLHDCEALGDAQLTAELHGQRSRLLRDMGRLDEAREAARQGLEYAEALGESNAVGILSFFAGAFEVDAGNLTEGRALLDRSVSIAHVYGERDLENAALSSLATIAFHECRIGDGVRLFRNVLEIAHELGQTRTETITSVNLAQAIPFTGDFEAAAEQARHARSVAGSLEYGEIHARSVLSLGEIYVQQGKFADALKTLHEAGVLIDEMPTPVLQVRRAVALASVHSWTGGCDEAAAVLEQALPFAEETQMRRVGHSLRWAAGLMHETQDRFEEAIAALEGLADESRETIRYLSLIDDLQLGALHAHQGNEERARTLLDDVRRLAEPGGMPGIAALCRFWLELLPGESLLHARLELEKHGANMPALLRLRAAATLARRTKEDALIEAARCETDALLDSMTDDQRERAMENVPVFKR